jgi:hypothetical protein
MTKHQVTSNMLLISSDPVSEISPCPSFGSAMKARCDTGTTTILVSDMSRRVDSTKDEEEGEEERTGPVGFDKSLPIKESLGQYGSVTILAGSTAILGTLGFMSFLWFGHGPRDEGKSATWVWREIALRGWMNRTITLCSMVIRVV